MSTTISYTYRATVQRVVDGDTVVCVLDVGFHTYHIEHLRLRAVNAPELFSGNNREAGAAARDFVRDWVQSADVRGEWPFVVTTYKSRESFGRYIADVVRVDTGESLADALVAAGHAV